MTMMLTGAGSTSSVMPYPAPTSLQTTGTPNFFVVSLTWTDPVFSSGPGLAGILIYQLQNGNSVKIYQIAPGVQSAAIISGDVNAVTQPILSSSCQFYVQGVDANGRTGGKATITVSPIVLNDLTAALNFGLGVADYSDAAGTVLCGIGDPIFQSTAIYGAGPNATQATSGNRPTQQANGAQFNTTSDLLPFATPFNVGNGVGADFGVYVWGTIDPSSTLWVPLGSTSSFAMLTVNSGFFTSAILSGGDAGILIGFLETAFATTGNVLIRMRRQGNSVYMIGTGVSEVSLSSSSYTDFGWSGVGKCAYGYNSSLNNRYGGFIAISGRDPSTDGSGDDATIQQFIAAQGNYSL